MWRIKGQTVTLYDQVHTGTDAFNAPISEEVPISVEGVLVGEPTTDEILSGTEMYGKTARYILGIPKNDRHDWEDKHVSWVDSRGMTVHARTFGHLITCHPDNVPGPWGAKVRCETHAG